MNNLPLVITDYIYTFIPTIYLTNLNTFYYDKYNSIRRDKILSNTLDSYIRDMVRKDNIYIIKYIISQYSHLWFKQKNIFFSSIKYKDYYSYILNYSLMQNSNNCYQYIKELNKRDQKRHKNVIAKKYKWKYAT